MRPYKKFLPRALMVLIAMGVLLWMGNSSWLVGPSPNGSLKFIAHRGVHQIYAGQDRNAQTCRAAQVRPFSHFYIENTLPSIQAAFDSGAHMVEIDVHPTTDGHLAVFHDWTLDCQTNGSGVTRQHSLAELQALDLGYGFTADGQAFPLRGQGVGLLPSLEQVLDQPLDGQILINFKGDDPEEAERLATLLSDDVRRAQVAGVYGGRAPTQRALKLIPGLRGYDRNSAQACLIRYMLLGWSGHMPAACKQTFVPVPLDYAPYLWGWPHRFTRRLDRAGSDLILLGPWDGSGFTSGIDDVGTLARVPDSLDAYVWTNVIETLGPHPLNTQ